METKHRLRIVSLIEDVQFKMLRTAALENKTHAERNQETRKLVKDLEHILMLVNMSSDEYQEVEDVPF